MIDFVFELCRDIAFSVKYGQTVVIAAGVVLAVVAAVLYRVVSRRKGSKYESGR